MKCPEMDLFLEYVLSSGARTETIRLIYLSVEIKKKKEKKNSLSERIQSPNQGHVVKSHALCLYH